jgi:hypothetical protein
MSVACSSTPLTSTGTGGAGGVAGSGAGGRVAGTGGGGIGGTAVATGGIGGGVTGVGGIHDAGMGIAGYTGGTAGVGGSPGSSAVCPPLPSYAPFGCAPTYSQQVASNPCHGFGTISPTAGPICGGWSWTCSSIYLQVCRYDAQQRLIYAEWCDDVIPGDTCKLSGCSCAPTGNCLESANLDPTVGTNCPATDASTDAAHDAGVDLSRDVAIDRGG